MDEKGLENILPIVDLSFNLSNRKLDRPFYTFKNPWECNGFDDSIGFTLA